MLASDRRGALLLLAGCGQAPSTTDGPGSATPVGPISAADLDGGWLLVSGVGPKGDIPMAARYRNTLFLTRDSAGGEAGCNDYGAQRVRIEGDRMRLREIVETLVDCGADETSASAFVDAIQRARHIGRRADQLVLSGPSTELAFVRIVPLPIDQIVGPTWNLETLGRTGLRDLRSATPRSGSVRTAPSTGRRVVTG
jgi:heat shock protein HslJ